jgi:hypothetical protein
MTSWLNALTAMIKLEVQDQPQRAQPQCRRRR